MRCVLGSLIIAYVWLPSLVIYLLAYGDDYIGRALYRVFAVLMSECLIFLGMSGWGL